MPAWEPVPGAKAPGVPNWNSSGGIPGLLTPGNINLDTRPIVQNPDGSYSTVRSITVGVGDGKYALIPTVVGNKVVSNKEAIDYYLKTGEHLGLFSSEDSADTYAKQLHEAQAKEYDAKAGKSSGGWEPVAGAKPPQPGFFGAAAKTLVEAGKAGVAHPGQIIPGAAETIAGGIGAFAGTAAGGVAGLGGGIYSKLRGGDFMEGFQQAKGAVEEGFSKIPLGSETEVGKKLGDVLALIPGGIHALGETVFEKTGNALAAAGTEGLATLLMMKPGLATKSVGWAFEKGTKAAGAEKVRGAFDDLVRTDPEKATELANHVDDKALKKELDKRISEITISQKKQVSDIFKRAKGETPSTVGEVKQIFEQAKQAGLKRGEGTPEADLQATVAAAHEAEGQAVSAAEKLREELKAHAIDPNEQSIADVLGLMAGGRREGMRPGAVERRQDLSDRVDKSLQLAEEAKTRAKQVGAELSAARDAGKDTKELIKQWKAARDEVGKHELDAKQLRDALEKTRVAAAKAPGAKQLGGAGNIARISKYVPTADTTEVYHGSPYSFTEFDASKIGTGEGAQAYGHGLYLAGSRSVGEYYKGSTGETAYAKQVFDLKAERDALKAKLRTDTPRRDRPGLSAKERTDINARLKQLDTEIPFRETAINRAGNLYTIHLPNKAIAKMLDWDKPVSDQPVAVIKALDEYNSAWRIASRPEWELHQMARSAKGSSILAKHGIPGIKYLDQQSRGLAGGTHNYVIFDPKLARVVKRNDEVVYMHAGIPVTRADLSRAFTLTRGVLKKAPIYNTIEREVKTSVEQLIRNVAPEALGPDAKLAAAVVAKNMAERMHQDSAHYNRALPRREFWNRIGPEASERFIDQFERGAKFSDPTMQKAAQGYKDWNAEIYQRDQALGLKYTPEENYLYHTFLDPEGVSKFFFQRFGPRWNDPRFIKDRGFDMYSQARANGFQPRFTNPEDIMLARQHASDVARMQVQTLRDMRDYGLARTVQKGDTAEPGFTQWRAPDGQRYWVQDGAAQILHNAFNTKSLWNMQGAVGSAFRGAMWLKNIVVPVKLALSLFHPLHVQTIDNATAMVRSTKELLAGTQTPLEWVKNMGKAAVYHDIISNPKIGYRVLNVWKGKVPEAKLTDADRVSLQYITEGGLIPEMSAQYKNRSIEAFKDSLQQHSATALYHLPFAMIQALQKPMFEVWIPSLKAASYLNDVRTALKVDPSLISDTPKRLETFRRLAKSVENRYGEMAYNTLFWNRWIKDLGVASTLSLGWNLGFIREYGGAIGDVAKAAGAPMREAAVKGTLDRPLFVAFYTTQALAYGGLLTWALTGKPPTQLLDYIFPQNGEKRPDGSPQRVNTMFYTREFASIYKHMENEGVVSGMGRLAANKASPLLDEAHTFLTNVNYLGQEISDPNAPAYKQLEQKVAYMLQDSLPITVQSVRKSKGTAKDYALSFAGFTPAPVYVTETPVEGQIKNLYHQYHKDITPFEKLEYGRDAAKLREAYQRRDPEEYAKQLLKMREEHGLTGKQMATLKRNIKVDPTIRMFSQLGASQQTQLLKKMSQQEQLKYLRHAKEEVRRAYRSGLK